jgi:hypothetical protein
MDDTLAATVRAAVIIITERVGFIDVPLRRQLID